MIWVWGQTKKSNEEETQEARTEKEDNRQRDVKMAYVMLGGRTFCPKSWLSEHFVAVDFEQQVSAPEILEQTEKHLAFEDAFLCQSFFLNNIDDDYEPDFRSHKSKSVLEMMLMSVSC